jgi:quercetin 2,3-dioxygenase
MKIRRADTRGILDAGWIKSNRSFSNNSYWDNRYQKWGNLRVINDDIQQPGNCVPNHEHCNYDILSYVISGELEHTDSIGNVVRARPGNIQHMWCGKSIWHTEASVGANAARYLQIWITPISEYFNTSPSYELIDKSPTVYGVIPVNLKQDMIINAGWLKGDHQLLINNRAYLYVIEGSIIFGEHVIFEGDAVELSSSISGRFNAHIIMFEE